MKQRERNRNEKSTVNRDKERIARMFAFINTKDHGWTKISTNTFKTSNESKK